MAGSSASGRSPSAFSPPWRWWSSPPRCWPPYLPAIVALTAGEPEGVVEYRENPTSFLLIATMDLGLFVPAAIATGFALGRGQGWARNALAALIGWLALVGLAVAAMAIVMRVQEAPGASTGQAVAFTFAGVVLAGLAARLYAPLLGTLRHEEQ